MSPHSKNACANIKHLITVAKYRCLIFTPRIAAPILTYNATEIIFENCLFSNLSHAFILANSAAMPDTSADRFFSVQPEMIELNAGTFSNPAGRLVFQGCRCGTPSWFVQIAFMAMLILFDITRSDAKFHFSCYLQNIIPVTNDCRKQSSDLQHAYRPGSNPAIYLKMQKNIQH